MSETNQRKIIILIPILILLICIISLLVRTVYRAVASTDLWMQPTWAPEPGAPNIQPPPAKTSILPPTRAPGTPILTPTPEQARPLPTLRTEFEEYTVQVNDTLALIAYYYGVDVDQLMQTNSISDPTQLFPGQILVIPPTTPQPPGPNFKIIPDSELVFGPVSSVFSCAVFIQQQGGYLFHYQGLVDGYYLSGAEIVERISREYSVNPRLLLAILEYQSGWVTQTSPKDETIYFPIGYYDKGHEGLFLQLAWAADNLNNGYYSWKDQDLSRLLLEDGSSVVISPTINAGTAAVQYLMAQLQNRPDWENSVSETGVFNTFQNLFGYPFDVAIEQLVPPGLAQPEFQLPFETGKAWSFTGGPHGGWGSGSAWAALDFAPPDEPQGCYLSDAWVVAITNGAVIRSENGVVIQDLDDDGIEQTGWSILYLHIDSHERIETGSFLTAGNRIGHPSCEGGFSNGTHLHIARRYNGEWIPADSTIPFVMGGWIPESSDFEYNGYLKRNDQVVEAWDSVRPENQIYR